MNEHLQKVVTAVANLRTAVSVLALSEDASVGLAIHAAPTGKTALVDELDALKLLLEGGNHATLSSEAEQRCVRIAKEITLATSKLVPHLAQQWLAAYPTLQAMVWGAYLQLLPIVSWAAAPPKDALPVEMFQQLDAYRNDLDSAEASLSKDRDRFVEMLDTLKLVYDIALVQAAELDKTLETVKKSAAEGDQLVQSLREGSKQVAALSIVTSQNAADAKASATNANEEASAAKSASATALAASKVIADAGAAVATASTTAAAAAGASTESAKEATASAAAAKAASLEGTAAATAIMESKPKIDELLASVTASAAGAGKSWGETERHAGRAASDAEIASKAVAAVQERLRVATSIGLAAAFSKRAHNLQRIGAIWAAVLIGALLGSWWLGSQRVTSLLESLQHADKYSPTTLWIQLAVTIFSVGAPIWLAWLSTTQVTHNFRLAEDYGYKATISQAYEGYRQEAVNLDPVFQARLFASALARLDENPLRLLSDYTPGSPLQDLFRQPWFQDALQTAPEMKKGFVEWLQTAGKTVIKPLETAANAIAAPLAEPPKAAVTPPPIPSAKAPA